MSPATTISTRQPQALISVAVIVVAALMLATSWPSEASAHVQRATIEPCPVVLEGVDMTDWQLVEAKGFTFCVPANWKVSGSRARFSGGNIQWKNGRAPDSRVAFRVGEQASPEAMAALVPKRTFSEIVNGTTAEFWTQSSNGTFNSGATWTAPAMYFTGTANGDAMIALQLNVYRTVRFAE
jgi:hypothetical protein